MKRTLSVGVALLLIISVLAVWREDLLDWIRSREMVFGKQHVGPGTWRRLARMPSARQEVATAVLQGRIFVIGGYDRAGVPTDTVQAYDPVTNHWSRAASLPIPTDHSGGATAAGRLYAFGGRLDRIFVYSPDRNSWSDVARPRHQHGNSAAVGVIADRIYVAGGTDSAGAPIDAVEVFDPTTNSWSQVASMNVARHHTAGGVIDGKLYVVGGRGHGAAATALEVYDPRTDTWQHLKSMPTGRSGIAAAVVQGKLYVFGGEGERIFPEVEVYDPRTDRWESLPPMPTPRHGLFAGVIGNRIYLPGGAIRPGFGATRVNEVFVLPD